MSVDDWVFFCRLTTVCSLKTRDLSRDLTLVSVDVTLKSRRGTLESCDFVSTNPLSYPARTVPTLQPDPSPPFPRIRTEMVNGRLARTRLNRLSDTESQG